MRKFLQHRRAGVKIAILPRKNQVDIDCLPEEVTEGIEIVLTEEIEEVIDIVLPMKASNGS